MPQMFPLLWFSLFILTAIALFSIMSCVHFMSKKYSPFVSSAETFNSDHTWKW